MIRASIMGATGYAGIELVRLLLAHPQVKLSRLSSVSFEGKALSEVYPALRGICDTALVGEEDVTEETDVLFCSLPAGHAEKIARRCVDKGILFIDLGADFRLDDEADYTAWYGGAYQDKALHAMQVYGLPELFGDRIPGAKIIGNPGCYPTSAALGLAPALREGLAGTEGIVIDSKSGVTGAGRGLTQTTHFPDCNEAFSPYKIACHRHTPEIEQSLRRLAGKEVRVTFVPHLLPLNRGIVSTIYAPLAGAYAPWAGAPLEEIHARYRAFYQEKTFVRVLPLGEAANLKNVRCSNYCDISLHLDARAGKFIIVSAIDNMVKGAAGQAIQNMNLALGLPETAGLMMVPPAI